MPDRIELTPSQRTRCNRLIRRLCANYDNGNCLPLDEGDGCVCVQMISVHLSAARRAVFLSVRVRHKRCFALGAMISTLSENLCIQLLVGR